MRYFVAIFGLATLLSVFAGAQTRNGPLVYDKPGDRDDSTQLIEGPRVMNVTANSAVIEWKTSGNGANHIRYGTVPNHPDKSAYVSGGSREHRMTLTGLDPGKTYYFYIMERDEEVRQGGAGSFTTPPPTGQMNSPVPAPAPVNTNQRAFQPVKIVNGPVVEHVDNQSAVIAWSTNVPSSSLVHYGNTPFALGQVAEARWGETTHRVQLSNLRPHTTYYYRIESGQAEGTGTDAKSQELSFKTP